MKLKYRRAVFIVVYSGEKDKIFYLLLKRKLHWIGWEFPKGGIDKGENPFQTVKREMKEETGHSSKKIKRFNFRGEYRYPRGIPDRKGIIGQSYSLYAAEIKKEKVVLDSHEHSTYKWVPYSQAMKMLKHSNQKTCLKKVNDWIKKKG